MRSSTDEQWYCAVINTLGDGTATVTFVDFGIKETLMTEELRVPTTGTICHTLLSSST